MDQWMLLSGAILSLIFGALIGSFLNVIVLRTAGHRSFMTGRSRCPNCGRTLTWFELVPVFSYVMLGGRCRTCKKNISLQYVLMEVLTATTFAIVWLRFGWSLMTVTGWLVTATLLIIAVYDARWSLIPDGFTASLVVAAATVTILGPVNWLNIFLGVVIGAGVFFFQYLVSRGTWVGSGDVLLGGALGLLLGWRLVLGAIGLSYILGAVVAMPLLLRGGAKKMMPFGPFLALGSWLVWLWGAWLWQWYLLHL